MLFLYTIATHLLSLGMRVAAFWNKKIRLGLEGRKNWRKVYAQQFEANGKVLWMHVASLGEFEQGRPVLEAFRVLYPDWKIVLTFFSPSGFEMRKNYAHADFIAYLPLDTPSNAADFLDLVQPNLAIFVKYEFWPYYLLTLKKRNTPTLLIAALFRPEQPFFHRFGAFWKKMIFCFEHIFTQTPQSAQLLQSIGYQNITIAGDTRIDRVLQIAANAPKQPTIATFTQDAVVLVVGSSWGKDEDLLLEALRHPSLSHCKVICAPHEPSPAHVARLQSLLGIKAITYSAATQAIPFLIPTFQWLIIDNIGMLNTLYKYGDFAYIGGGFGQGIHNTLEPAAFGLPVIFGPKYHKFEEAKQLVAHQGAFCVHNSTELQQVLMQLLEPDFREAAAQKTKQYLEENKGGTAAAMDFINKKLNLK